MFLTHVPENGSQQTLRGAVRTGSDESSTSARDRPGRCDVERGRRQATAAGFVTPLLVWRASESGTALDNDGCAAVMSQQT